MLGVMLGDKHSFHDYALFMKSYPAITPPTMKTKYVDVPGADGALDLSRTLTGYMQYNRRTITMEFTITAPREEWPDVHSRIMDDLHGQEVSIVLDDDPEYFYTGTLSVQGYDPQKVTSGVTILADVEPYKTKVEPTRRTFAVSGSLTASITVMRKPVIPVITASADMEMTYGAATVDLPAGESIFPDLILRKGVENTFTFKGNGSVTFEYREGRF